MFEAQGIKVAMLESTVDTQFATMIEQIRGGVKFVRVDADVASALKGDGQVSEDESLKELFKKVSGNDNLKITFEAFKDQSIPVLLNIPEEARRLDEMMKLYGMSDGASPSGFPVDITLVINTNSAIINKLSAMVSSSPENATLYADYLYKLATLSSKRLSPEEMNAFLKDSYTILERLTEN